MNLEKSISILREIKNDEIFERKFRDLYPEIFTNLEKGFEAIIKDISDVYHPDDDKKDCYSMLKWLVETIPLEYGLKFVGCQLNHLFYIRKNYTNNTEYITINDNKVPIESPDLLLEVIQSSKKIFGFYEKKVGNVLTNAYGYLLGMEMYIGELANRKKARKEKIKSIVLAAFENFIEFPNDNIEEMLMTLSRETNYFQIELFDKFTLSLMLSVSLQYYQSINAVIPLDKPWKAQCIRYTTIFLKLSPDTKMMDLMKNIPPPPPAPPTLPQGFIFPFQNDFSFMSQLVAQIGMAQMQNIRCITPSPRSQRTC